MRRAAALCCASPTPALDRIRRSTLPGAPSGAFTKRSSSNSRGRLLRLAPRAAAGAAAL